MIIHAHAYARAGLVGNPSDGYFGKTISFIVRNFVADVVLYETPELEILPNDRDHSRFESISALAQDVRQFGYYGGIRLLKAAVKRFHDYALENGIALRGENFTIRYRSNIPGQVGMAGSSAIITACMRALMKFYNVNISKPVLANLILSVENNELTIPAGLQDRVIQVYEGLVYMDFSEDLFQKQGFGNYEELDPRLLPPVYLAYRTDLSEGTEVFHNDIRGRFNRGDPALIDAMKFWADLAERAKAHLLAGERDKIGPLLDANFDKRREIYKISDDNIRMVEVARSAGASAKFTGSGGAIVGTYEDEPMFQRLVQKLEPLGVRVFKPMILPSLKT
ncbi:MAG: glucuronokinase [Chthoniobacter sp.]|jgi:glucuronokinase|nr:glucuronokinase [Chthoniobacter sp.]